MTWNKTAKTGILHSQKLTVRTWQEAKHQKEHLSTPSVNLPGELLVSERLLSEDWGFLSFLFCDRDSKKKTPRWPLKTIIEVSLSEFLSNMSLRPKSGSASFVFLRIKAKPHGQRIFFTLPKENMAFSIRSNPWTHRRGRFWRVKKLILLESPRGGPISLGKPYQCHKNWW